MLHVVEVLERRRLLDGAVTGGPGHAGFIVDVHGPDGHVVGVLQTDYYAVGYMGETQGTEGSSSGNSVTGTQGRLMAQYTPNTSVDQVMHHDPTKVIHGDIEQDKNTAATMQRIGGNEFNVQQLAQDGVRKDQRMDAHDDPESGFNGSTYYVTSNNCYSYSAAMFCEEANWENEHDDGLPVTWDDLQNMQDEYWTVWHHVHDGGGTTTQETPVGDNSTGDLHDELPGGG